MIRLIFLLLILGTPAAAQTVRVTSGQHKGFVRLALHVPAGAGWRLGRVEDGYELQLAAVSGFDVSRVFQRIGRDDLSAIWADPQTGNLRLRVDCACHAIPFQYRPDVVVIDLRDGPPPSASSFETALNGTPLPPLQTRAQREPSRPQPRPVRPAAYDWVALGRSGGAAVNHPSTRALPAADGSVTPAGEGVTGNGPDTEKASAGGASAGGPGPEELAQSLLQQLSQGAAEGVVDFRRSIADQAENLPPVTDPGHAQVRVESAPGRLERVDPKPLAAKGEICPDEQHLALQDWIGPPPYAPQLAAARNGLMGEFDRPDAEAVTRTTKLLLALGFGVEAQQLLASSPPDAPQSALWRSIAHIIDETADPEPAFAAFAACDNPAALWAVLSQPGPGRGDYLAAAAIERSFSRLPSHLRLLLGPRLVDRMITLERRDIGETIAAALRRIPADGDAASAVVGARLALAGKDPVLAEALSAPIAQSGTPMTTEAMIALIEARSAQDLPIPAEQVLAVEALRREHRNSSHAAALARALILARAASGDFDGAFAMLHEAPQTERELWRKLLRSGTNDQFLIHAVGRGPVPAAKPFANDISTRLLDLGLGQPAAQWLAAGAEPDAEGRARAALLDADGRGALRALAGAQTPEAKGLRAEALSALGDHQSAAAIYAELGQTEAADAARLRASDWAGLAADGSGALRDAAGLTQATPASASDKTEMQLQQARELLRKTEAARSRLEELLAATTLDD